MTEFIRAVRERRGYLFQRQYRDIDVLLLDDVQFLARAEETQSEFFHTFNHLHQHERQIVIACDRPPQELGGIEERLRSRFRCGPGGRRPAARPRDADRDPPAQGRSATGCVVPEDVQHYIASKFDSNIRELEGALLRVAAFASLSRQPVDLRARRARPRGPDPRLGQRDHRRRSSWRRRPSTSASSQEDLLSKSRSRPLTTARHVAMYLLRELTGLSLIKIGELFERDHTTALHGIKKIEALMPARGSVYRQVQELTKKIRARSRRPVSDRPMPVDAGRRIGGIVVHSRSRTRAPDRAAATAGAPPSPQRPRVVPGGTLGRRPVFHVSTAPTTTGSKKHPVHQ